MNRFLFLMLFSVSVSAAEVYEVRIKEHLFYPDRVYVKANSAFVLKFINGDIKAEEVESFTLNFERIIAAGQSAELHVRPLKPGQYSFFGKFHPQTALGYIVSE